jgi:hypothetical protein
VKNIRTTHAKEAIQDEAGAAKGQARPTEDRFLLRVSGQVKRSFGAKEAAATASAATKKLYTRSGFISGIPE